MLCLVLVFGKDFTSKPVERIILIGNCVCVCGRWGSFTATGRYNFVGADVFDTHALMRHPSNFVLHVRLVQFLRRYNVQHLRYGFGAKSIDCSDRIEQLAVDCHLHVSSQTIHREKRVDNSRDTKVFRSIFERKCKQIEYRIMLQLTLAPGVVGSVHSSDTVSPSTTSCTLPCTTRSGISL